MTPTEIHGFSTFDGRDVGSGEPDRATSHGLTVNPAIAPQQRSGTEAFAAVVGIVTRGATSVATWPGVIRIVMIPTYARLVVSYPNLPFRYLTDSYLTKGFTVSERCTCFTHHYRWLYENLSRQHLGVLLKGGWHLASLGEVEESIEITVSFCGRIYKEGELLMTLRVAGEVVYSMGFTIVPGVVLGSQATSIFLVSRMQGTRGKIKEISQIYRTRCGAGPAAILLAALQGFGEAAGIGAIACISGKDQTSYVDEFARSFSAGYDQFFSIRGAEKNESNVFVAKIPLQEKPLENFKKGLRSRTVKRRELKRGVVESVRECVSSFLHPNRTAPDVL